MNFKEKSRIGFVILVWNSEKVIGKCLDSIFRLESFSPVIVIVDNGSSDSTLNIVKKKAIEHPGQIIVKHYDDNRGTTITRNEGLKELSSSSIPMDLYCILDSDTEINDSALLMLEKEFKKHPEYGIIGPKMVTSSGQVQMSARCFPTFTEKVLKAVPIKGLQKIGEEMEKQIPPDPAAYSYPVDYLMSACWILRPELIEKAGLLDEKIFYAPEDAEYCIRVWKSGYQVAFCPKAQIIHEWQRLSKKKLISKINWEHIKGLVYMFNKHHYFLSTNSLKKSFSADR